MKTTLVFVFLVFLLKHKVTYASMWTQRYTELNVYLQEFTLESSKVDDIFECCRKCEDIIHCASINMNLMDKTCELKYSTKTRHPEKTVSQQNTIYMEIRDDETAPGSRPGFPISSCKKLKENDSQAKSGIYWMRFNEPSSAPFQVFCDMTTDGGGWTLVYSYTFSKFDDFATDLNNVTPAPNWPLNMSPANEWSPISTTTPLNESSYSAMEFSWWKRIGTEFLLKCNIINWVACVEGTGSFVSWRSGSLTCRVVKAITPTCTTIAPDRFEVWGCGVAFKDTARSYQFVLDVQFTLSQCRPNHDPCANNSYDNYLKNVNNPGCALYVR